MGLCKANNPSICCCTSKTGNTIQSLKMKVTSVQTFLVFAYQFFNYLTICQKNPISHLIFSYLWLGYPSAVVFLSLALFL